MNFGQTPFLSFGIEVPSWYLVDISGTSAAVWARGSSGKLEKRSVTLGIYDEMLDQYEIVAGLDLGDYIAFPEEGLKEGMPTTEFDESAFQTGDDNMSDSMIYPEEGFTDVVADDEAMDTVDNTVTATPRGDGDAAADGADTADGGTAAEGSAE